MLGERLQILLLILVIIVLIGGLLGLSQEILGNIINLFAAYAILPTITSFFAGMLVEAIGGGSLKMISLTIDVKGFRFSITAFMIAVLAVKLLLF